VIYEGYFDESGDFADESKVFCISGYFIEANNAREMTKEWVAVLAEYGLPFFHMVECAHGDNGDSSFARLSKDQRIEVATRLIGLIKRYTIQGYSAVAHADHFKFDDKRSDVYSSCADLCVSGLLSFLDTAGIDGSTAYFFESGHSSENTAYRLVAKKLEEKNASVTFATKSAVPLLQAADILAWQSAKYVKDRMAQRRKPRADFLSLMEHKHDLVFVTYSGEEQESLTFELWPQARRSRLTSSLQLYSHATPNAYMTENEGEIPIYPAQETLGWRESNAQMVIVGYKNLLSKKDFAVAFDERALCKSALVQIEAMRTYSRSSVKAAFIAAARKALDKLETASNQEPPSSLPSDSELSS